MIKWEYKTVFNDMQVTDESITNFLNAEGAEGWELVNILYLFGTFQAIFKRQLEENAININESSSHIDDALQYYSDLHRRDYYGKFCWDKDRFPTTITYYFDNGDTSE